MVYNMTEENNVYVVFLFTGESRKDIPVLFRIEDFGTDEDSSRLFKVREVIDITLLEAYLDKMGRTVEFFYNKEYDNYSWAFYSKGSDIKLKVTSKECYGSKESYSNASKLLFLEFPNDKTALLWFKLEYGF